MFAFFLPSVLPTSESPKSKGLQDDFFAVPAPTLSAAAAAAVADDDWDGGFAPPGIGLCL